MEVRPPQQKLRDPFAWREALSPQVTPPASRQHSRAGSVVGGGSGHNTPRSATPPMSPAGNSARSSHSGHSARSGTSARGALGGAGYPGVGHPPHDNFSARSALSGYEYTTPNPSARSSEFASVYDASSSACASARTFLSGDQGGGNTPPQMPACRERPSRTRQPGVLGGGIEGYGLTTGAAQGGSAGSAAEPCAEPSLDPRQVFSAARHGRHKEVEASLEAGFDPTYADQFGNTLFHVACQNGNKRISKSAIKYGGNMDQQNGKGNTGLHFLFAYGYPDIAEYFIEKGASEDVLNECSKGPREGIR